MYYGVVLILKKTKEQNRTKRHFICIDWSNF
uniref:Uncharacterized protein n=1 Tax=Arundo donax TaxID=35708 RepID=A0A0A8ZU13_ARUDO